MKYMRSQYFIKSHTQDILSPTSYIFSSFLTVCCVGNPSPTAHSPPHNHILRWVQMICCAITNVYDLSAWQVRSFASLVACGVVVAVLDPVIYCGISGSGFPLTLRLRSLCHNIDVLVPVVRVLLYSQK